MQKILQVQMMRAVSIIMVVLYHFFPNTFSFGYLGVDVFFVISGFIVSQIVTIRKPTAMQFIASRVSRLIGSAIIILLPFTVFVFFSLQGNELKDFLQSAIAFFLGLSNFLFSFEASYFVDFAIRKPLLHTWSLSIELQFYVVAAIGLALFKKHTLKVLIVLGVISLTLYTVVLFSLIEFRIPLSASNDVALFFNPIFRFWQFSLGIGAAYYFQKNRHLSLTILISLICVGFLLLIWSSPQISQAETKGLIVISLSFCVFLCLIFCQNIPVNRFLVSIGDSSYLLYLVHFPMIFILEWYGLTNSYFLLSGFLISFYLSHILTLKVDIPVQKFFKKNSSLIFVSPLISFALLSVYIINKDFKYEYHNFKELSEQINSDRLHLIDSVLVGGKCQYFNGAEVSVSDFLEDWSCEGENLKTYIFGDSTAADLKMAFRESGIEVGHMGGAGCSIDPKAMTEECKAIFHYALHRLNERRDNTMITLLLRQRYSGSHLTDDVYERIVNFWTVRNSQIVIAPFPIEVPRMKGIYSVLATKGSLNSKLFIRRDEHDHSVKFLNDKNALSFNPDKFLFDDKVFIDAKVALELLKDQVHWAPGHNKHKINFITAFCAKHIC